MSDPRFEAERPFTGEEIKALEVFVGRSLPESYKAFLTDYGGAFVGGLVDGAEDLPISGFFGVCGERGVLNIMTEYPDFRDEGALPFGDCVLGNLWVLDRNNQVYYINYYGGCTSATKVADSFENFLSRIVVTDE